MTNTQHAATCTCGTDDRWVYDVTDVMRILGISRRTVEELIRAGQLKSYKVRSLRKIDRQAVRDYLDSVAC